MPSYKINSKLITQKLGEKTVLFDGKESVLFTMNETASIIFRMIKAKSSPEKIVARLMKEYGITEARAKKDIQLLIKDLLGKKILLPVKK